MERLYGSHPLLTTKDPEEVSRYIERLCTDESFHASEGERFSLWARTYHSKEGAGRIYIDQLASRLG
jgi:hypothetical protein